MSAKHTPGPWIVGSNGTTVLHMDDTDLDHPYPAVVNTVSGRDSMEYGEACANARLIAAAPELLAALRNFLTTCEHKEHAYACEQARAAIAKAVQS